ncbi:MAG: pinensin family lanthipeptide [Phaeodactylibacter sp.]|nr:pinensin family lanthipeptide [Phaeodactylibacter sp.]
MKEKLKLEDLRIQSFVTVLDEVGLKAMGIIGGTDATGPCDNPVDSEAMCDTESFRACDGQSADGNVCIDAWENNSANLCVSDESDCSSNVVVCNPMSSNNLCASEAFGSPYCTPTIQDCDSVVAGGCDTVDDCDSKAPGGCLYS